MHEEQVTVAHLSDLHLPLPDRVPWTRMLNKRLIGWTNARLLRSKRYRPEPCRELIAHLAARRVDLVLITGDLVSLALEQEFARVDDFLRRAGLQPGSTLVLPGNHDRYTPGAARRRVFERGLGAWLPAGLERDGWPWARRLGPVLVAGLDTAVWRGPLRAAGRLEPGQLARLEGLAEQAAAEQRHLVVAMHHPPYRLQGRFFHQYRSGLQGLERLRPLRTSRPATVLCGHLHRAVRRRLDRWEVLCVPSASHDAGRPEEQLAYHLYTFGRRGLLAARAVRHWPAEGRFEEIELPAASS